MASAATKARVRRQWKPGERGDPTRRPMPHDFRERGPNMTFHQIMTEWRTGYDVARRWLAEIGIERKFNNEPTPMPEGFEAVAAKWTSAELERHFDISGYVVLQLRRRLGINLSRRGVPTEMPATFRAAASRCSIKVLSERYGVCPAIVQRWRKQLGITGHIHLSRYNRDGSVSVRSPNARSSEELAARHLARFGAVYRCTAKGDQRATGDHWRYGNMILTSDEMLARAQRKGWSPDAWREIAG